MEKDYKKTGWVNGSEPDMDAEHMNNIEDGIDGLYHPVFDDSGTVEGITNFPQFLSTVVNKMNPIAFYKNFKAGMAFVLHAGQLVNNGLCNEPGKYPLDAAYGKTLYDYYERLNSDLATSQNAVLFHLGDTQNELYGCDVGGVVGNVLQFNLLGSVSGRAVFSTIKLHINRENTLKVIFNTQVNINTNNVIEYVGLDRESPIKLWGVPLI